MAEACSQSRLHGAVREGNVRISIRNLHKNLNVTSKHSSGAVWNRTSQNTIRK